MATILLSRVASARGAQSLVGTTQKIKPYKCRERTDPSVGPLILLLSFFEILRILFVFVTNAVNIP